MIPFFEVSHLPSSASFYSAVLQPLGLVYISTESSSQLPVTGSSSSNNTQHSTGLASYSSPTVTYGTSSRTKAVLQIREVARPKRSHVTLSASSSQAVADFQAFAIRANPASSNLSHQSLEAIATPDGGDYNRTRIRDLDGNIMDVVHVPPSESRRDDASRILDWTYDVALSDHNHGPAPSATGGPTSTGAKQSDAALDKAYTVLRRSVTTSVVEQPHRENGDSGLGSSTVVGALLGAAAGAAAGAALTYNLMKAERERAPRQEHEIAPVQRRATFPDGVTGPADGRYVEVERTVERIRYPEGYAHLADQQQASRQLAQYEQPNALTSGAANDYYDDPQSRHLWEVRSSGPGSVYSRVEGPPPPGAPLMLMGAEQYSTIGSSRHSTLRAPSVRGSVYEADRESFVSAQSRRSASTIRGPPPPTVETELSVRSRAPSMAPSKAPSMAPSKAPSMAPSRAPSMAPSKAPSMAPSKAPSMAPSRAPSMPPSKAPSMAPSKAPSKAPSRAPSMAPSKAPSMAPSKAPSRAPSMAPSKAPSMAPSKIGGRSEAMMSTGHSVFHSIPPSASYAPTQVSARNIGLPASGIGSSDGDWEDVASLAPSDSISCIGSRASRRG